MCQGLGRCCNLLQGDGLPLLGEPIHPLDLLDSLAELGRLSRVLYLALLELVVINNLT